MARTIERVPPPHLREVERMAAERRADEGGHRLRHTFALGAGVGAGLLVCALVLWFALSSEPTVARRAGDGALGERTARTGVTGTVTTSPTDAQSAAGVQGEPRIARADPPPISRVEPAPTPADPANTARTGRSTDGPGAAAADQRRTDRTSRPAVNERSVAAPRAEAVPGREAGAPATPATPAPATSTSPATPATSASPAPPATSATPATPATQASTATSATQATPATPPRRVLGSVETGPGPRVVLHVDRSAAEREPARLARLAERLRGAGAGSIEMVEVDVRIGRDQLRFYFDDDRADAQRLAAALAIPAGQGTGPARSPEVRDFTFYRPLPRGGTIEIWLASSTSESAAFN